MNPVRQLYLWAGIGGTVLVALILDGCTPAPAEKVFQPQDAGRVVVCYVDVSASMDEHMRRDGRAYRLLTRIVSHYLRSNSKDRLIIARLSADKQALIFDGSAQGLLDTYPDEDAFHRELKRADPNGSRLFDSISAGIDYVMEIPGVQSGVTKVALLIWSDLIDNASDVGAEQRLLNRLTEVGSKGGVVGMYFVQDENLTKQWRGNLKNCGIKDFIVEPHFKIDPEFPNF